MLQAQPGETQLHINPTLSSGPKMVTPHPLSADASNKFEDLSGTSGSAFANPYDALIDACHDDAVTKFSSPACRGATKLTT